MFVTKLKMIMSVVLVLALVLSGGGLLVYSALQSKEDNPGIVTRPPKLPGEKLVSPPQPKADLEPDMPPAALGDGLETPLPQGAIVRFGTTRYRTGSTVGSMKLSPDGKKLVTGGRASGGGVFVWDAATGKRILWRPLGEEGEFSRDGERLFLIETLPLPPPAKGKPPATPVEVSPLLTERKNALKIYDLATGKLLQQIDNASWLCRFAVAADGTLALEYADRDGEAQIADGMANFFHKSRLELYDLKTGRVLHRLGEPQPRSLYPGSWLRFSQDGKTLFVIDRESKIKRFDVATGALKPQTAIAGVPFIVADKTLIVAGNKIWDLEKERLLWTLKGSIGTGKADQLHGIYAFTPDCRTVIGSVSDIKPVEGTGSSVVEWDLETDREIRRLPNHAAYAISPDGKTGFGTDWTGVNGRWFRWDIATGKEVDAVDAPISPPGPVAFSPDGKYVATVDSTFSAFKTFDREKKYFVVRLWDRATGTCLRQTPVFLANRLFFTPDGKSLVYSSGLFGNPKFNGSNQRWVDRIFAFDVGDWKQTQRDFEETGSIGMGDCRLSPDGKLLAAPSHTGPWIDLWDWSSGKLVGKLDHKYPGSGPVAFSADSKRLTLLFFPQQRVQVWNVADSKLISDRELPGWPKEVHSNAQIIADGKLLAAGWLPHRGPWRGMLRFPEHMNDPIPDDWPAMMPPMPAAVAGVWDTATGKEKVRFNYPQNENMGDIPALFSPDGKLVATANYHDEVVHFRDPASGKEVGRFRCGGNGVNNMAFSPDSQALAVSAKDTTVLLVDVRKVIGTR